MDFNGFETMKLRYFLLSALVAFFSLVSCQREFDILRQETVENDDS